tara:strand:+ start:1065 stop:1859 length:795 start_codon:yes stop_codon:yes gene_type:complete
MLDTEAETLKPTPYRADYRRELDNQTDEEILSEDKQEEEEETAPEEPGVPLAEPNVNWKKRYDDMRTYHNRYVEKHRSEEQVPDLVPPQTLEELDKFKVQYPEVYNSMKAISRLESDGRIRSVEDRLEDLQEKEEEAVQTNARAELLRRHPDFDDLTKSDEFNAWLETQPSQITDGVTKNNTDAAWAARVIDLYKNDTGQSKPKSKKSKSDDAAAEIRPTSRGSDPSKKEDRIWTNEEISRLKPAEFARLEKEIDKANREGRVR